jgi:hypothetical protein
LFKWPLTWYKTLCTNIPHYSLSDKKKTMAASISGLSIFDCPLTFISSDEHKMRNVVGYFTYYIWIKLQIIWSCTFTGEDFKFQIHKNKNYIRRPWFFFCLIKNNEVCLYIMFCIGTQETGRRHVCSGKYSSIH